MIVNQVRVITTDHVLIKWEALNVVAHLDLLEVDVRVI
jgi:hypothetical protein